MTTKKKKIPSWPAGGAAARERVATVRFLWTGGVSASGQQRAGRRGVRAQPCTHVVWVCLQPCLRLGVPEPLCACRTWCRRARTGGACNVAELQTEPQTADTFRSAPLSVGAQARTVRAWQPPRRRRPEPCAPAGRGARFRHGVPRNARKLTESPPACCGSTCTPRHRGADWMGHCAPHVFFWSTFLIVNKMMGTREHQCSLSGRILHPFRKKIARTDRQAYGRNRYVPSA